jgi:hypothetical protein
MLRNHPSGRIAKTPKPIFQVANFARHVVKVAPYLRRRNLPRLTQSF